MKYLIGNWKSHKTSREGRAWLDTFSNNYRPSDAVKIVVAPSFVALENLAEYCQSLVLPGFSLACQDLSPYPRGSYTGAVAADLLTGLASYAILGHSERRSYFHETVQEIINKAGEAVEAGLVPILCLESTAGIRQYWPVAELDCKDLIVAYTPKAALKSRVAERPAVVAQAFAEIRQLFAKNPLIYGGAMDAANLISYLEIKELGGIFVGGASLDPVEFARLHHIMAAAG